MANLERSMSRHSIAVLKAKLRIMRLSFESSHWDPDSVETLASRINRCLANGLLVLLLLADNAVADPSTPDDAITANPVKGNDAAVSPAKGDDATANPGKEANAIPKDRWIITNLRAAPGLQGWGQLGRFLGLSEESGVSLGGVLGLNGNWLASGGVRPDTVINSLGFLLNASLDTERALGIPGGKFGVEYGVETAGAVNDAAGSVQLYNVFPDTAPRRRQQLNQLWWQQRLFDDKLTFHIGKMNAAGMFAQPLIPVGIPERQLMDITISNLLFVPAGLNPTMFDRLPAPPNPAYGVTVQFAPTNNIYASYGLFDGNNANEVRGIQTGLRAGPEINSYKFHIGELGYVWRLGEQGKPGRFGIGGWGQTGQLLKPDFTFENGATGFYVFGNQRLWYQHPSLDNSGLIGFLQFGYTDSNSGQAKKHVGAGLTGEGLVPGRHTDTINLGMAWSELNDTPGAGAFFAPGVPSNSVDFRESELMFQATYMANFFFRKFGYPKGFSTFHVLGAYSYIPTPGQRPDLPAAHAFTVQLSLMF